MRKLTLVRFVSVALLLIAFASPPPTVHAEEPVRDACGRAIAWLETHQAVDGRFGDGLAQRDTAEALCAFASAESSATTLTAGWLESREASNTDFLARKVEALAAAARPVASEVASLTAEQNADGGFGLARPYGSDSLDTALACSALSAAGSEAPARAAAAWLLSECNADGGWPLVDGGPSSLLATAKALSALTAYAEIAASPLAGLSSAANEGVAWLTARQRQDGSFGDATWQTAEAYLALKAAGGTFDEPAAIAHLRASQAADGSFGGDAYLTALCARALIRADVNLAVSGLELSNASPRTGEIVTATARVANTGRNATPAGELTFRVDEGAGSVPLGEAGVPALDPGGTADVTFNFDTADRSVVATVSAEVDPIGRIAETDKEDNAAFATLTPRSPLLPPLAVLPSDGGLLTDASPELLWQPAPTLAGETLTYVVQLDRTPAFDSAMLRTHSLSPLPGLPVSYEPSEPLAQGLWYWRVSSSDGLAASAWTAVRRLEVDSVAPLVSDVSASRGIISPNGDARFDSVDYAFYVSEPAQTAIEFVASSGVVVRRIEQGGGSGPRTASWDGLASTGIPAPDGTHAVRLTTTDAAGNTTATSFPAVSIDTSAPSVTSASGLVSVFSPNGDGYSEIAHFYIQRSEALPVTMRVFSPRGYVVWTQVADSAAFTWNGRDAYGQYVADGEYGVTFQMEDAAGNRSEERRVPVVVDATAEVGALRVSPLQVAPGEDVELSISISDDSTATVTIDGVQRGFSDGDGDGIHTLRLNAPAEIGNHVVTLSAEDGLKNRRTTAASAIVVRGQEITGREWVTDTQTDFKTRSAWPLPDVALDDVTANERPGSVMLDAKGWVYKPSLPDARHSAATCLGPDGKIFVFGGYFMRDSGGGISHEPRSITRVYDPATETWSTRASIPSLRAEPRAVTAPNGKIYVVGGVEYRYSAGWLSQVADSTMVEAFDPATDTWERDANHGGTLAPMPTGRGFFGMTVGADGRLYAFGGFNSAGSSAAVEVYDPVTNTWEVLPPMPRPTCCFASTSDSLGTIYVVSGESLVPGSTTDLNDVWAYDPVTGAWASRAPSPRTVERAACAQARDGSIYVYGGDNEIGYTTNEVWAFDPSANAWRQRTSLLEPTMRTQGVADLTGRLYAIGGGTAGPYGSFVPDDAVQCFDSDRAPVGTYTSPVKDLYGNSIFGSITWDADVPAGTSVTVRTRTSTNGSLWSAWSEPYVASGSSVTSPAGRYVQYQVELTSPDPCVSPVLDRVAIVYNRTPDSEPVYEKFVKRSAPDLAWDFWWDAEPDPVVYDVQIDRTATFDTPELRSYEGYPATGHYALTMRVPTEDALADGEWYWRVRGRDAYSSGEWSSAPLHVDRSPVGITLQPDPTSFSPGSENVGTTTIRYTVDEPCYVDGRIVRTSSILKSWGVSLPAAGTYEFAWNGTDDQGATVSGACAVNVTATDRAGNVSAATSEVLARERPQVGGLVSLSSDPSDPSAFPVLTVPTSGSVTHVRANVASSCVELVDGDRDGSFTATLSLSPGTSSVDSIEAIDSVTGAIDAVSNVSAVVSGYLDGALWTDTSQADFAGGTLDGMSTRGTDCLALVEDAWQAYPASLSQGRFRAAYCQVGSTVYAVGGRTGPASGLSSLAEAVDLSTGDVRALPPVPTAREYAAAAPGPDGKIYVFGGYGGQNTVEVYDPVADTWQTLPPMYPYRYGASALRHGSHIYVFGGTGLFDPQVRRYDPATGAWVSKTAPPSPIKYAAAVAYGEDFYFFGGQGSKKVQVYTPSTDTWSTRGDLDATWNGHSATVLGDKILLSGSGYGTSDQNACFLYDPATDSYQRLPVTSTRRFAGAIGSWDGAAYHIGGMISTQAIGTASIESYRLDGRGRYVSKVHDVGKAVAWRRIGWSGAIPQGTALSVTMRTSVDGAQWSEWSAECTSGAAIASPAGRYVQYRLDASSVDKRLTPTVGDVSISWIDEDAGKPSAPLPLSPDSGAAVFDSAPTLGWLNSHGGVIRTYDVQLDTSSTFDSPLARNRALVAELPGTSVLPVASTAPLAEGTWYWRVRGISERGAGPWSPVASFAVFSEPNLTVSSVIMPSGTEEGDAATVSATVLNEGAPAASVRVRFFDGDPASGGTQFGDDVVLASLGYGESADVSRVLATSGVGIRDVCVVVDPDERIAESDEGDNTSTAQLAVAPNGLTVAPVLEFDDYAPSELVTVTVSVTNEGLRARSAECVIEVMDGQGVLAETVASRQVALDGGQSVELSAVWDSAGYYVGDYVFRARLVEDDRSLAVAEDAFSVSATVALDAKATVGRLRYSANQTVAIQSRVTNRTQATTMRDLTVITQVLAPDNTVVLTESVVVPELLSGELRTYANSWETGGEAPGLYHVSEQVLSATGELLAGSTASFEVLPTELTGAGLTGAMSAETTSVHQTQDVAMRWSLSNGGNSALTSAPVEVVFADPETGSTVATVSATVSLPVGAEESGTAVLSTSDLGLVTEPEGRHVLAVLRSYVGGRWLTLGHGNVTVLPLRASLSAVADRSAYDCDEPASLTIAAGNETTGFPLAGLAVTSEVVAPDGSVLARETQGLETLAFGEQAGVTVGWSTARHAPGVYTTRARLDRGGLTLASAETSFAVLSTANTGTGLVAELRAAQRLNQGEPLEVSWTVTNVGNDHVTALPVRLELVDATSGETLRSFSRGFSLPLDGTHTDSLVIPTDDLPQVTEPHGRVLQLRLRAELPAADRTLALADSRMMPGVILEVTKETTSVPRVLVWADADANVVVAEETLNGIEALSRIVRTDTEFLTELRSGVWDTYVLLDTRKPLVAHFDEELVERANAGATVIASRGANMDNLKEAGLFGVKYTGMLHDESRTFALSPTSVTPTGTLSVSGAMQRLAAESADVLASTGGYPAITRNACGRGTAILYAFDLAGTSGVDPADLLGAAITGAPSRATHTDALDVAAVGIRIVNAGVPLTVHLAEQVSGAVPVTASDTLVQPDGGLLWTAHLDRGGEARFRYLVRLPQDGSVQSTTTVTYQMGSDSRAYDDFPLDLGAAASFDELCVRALAAVQEVPADAMPDRKLKAKVVSDLECLRASPPGSASEYGTAVFGLLKTLSTLDSVSEDTSAARLALDEVLAYCEAGWSL